MSMVIRIIYAAVAIVLVVLAYKAWGINSAGNFYESTAIYNNYAGPEDAETVIVEFVDYLCEPCRETHFEVTDFHKKHPDIKFVFINAAVKENSLPGLKLALAAGIQNKYYEVHEALMQQATPVEQYDIDRIAGLFGLDAKKLEEDMNSKDLYRHLLRSDRAGKKLKILSVPSFYINGYLFYPENKVPTGVEIERWLATATGS